jgi:hypothetical protein
MEQSNSQPPSSGQRAKDDEQNPEQMNADNNIGCDLVEHSLSLMPVG